MPFQDVSKRVFFKISLLLQHLSIRALSFLPSNARGNGDYVLGTEDFRGHTFVVDGSGFTHGFPGQSVCGEKLHAEIRAGQGVRTRPASLAIAGARKSPGCRQTTPCPSE